MNLLPRYNEKGELDTRLRVDPVTGDVGIGTPKEKKYMTKEEAITLLCEHFSEGFVRTIVEALKQEQDEPVAYINVEQRKLEWAKYTSWETPTVANLPKIPLYTTPQTKEWVGLTDEEIDQGLLRSFYALQSAGAWREGVAWAMQQLKDKNNV